MTDTYEYAGLMRQVRIEESAHGDGGAFLSVAPHGDETGIHLPASERAKAAQALAGDGYEVVEKIADWECEVLEKQSRIDPTGVKVGDVVEVTLTGTVISHGDVGFGLHVNDEEDVGIPYDAATVRVVRPAPDPAGDQVVAINTILRGIERDAGGDLSDLSAPRIARDLYAAGVRVVKDGEQ